MKSSAVPSLKVAELREALKERGLSTTGTKAVLAERLLTALAAEEKEDMGASDSSSGKGDASSEDAVGASELKDKAQGDEQAPPSPSETTDKVPSAAKATAEPAAFDEPKTTAEDKQDAASVNPAEPPLSAEAEASARSAEDSARSPAKPDAAEDEHPRGKKSKVAAERAFDKPTRKGRASSAAAAVKAGDKLEAAKDYVEDVKAEDAAMAEAQPEVGGPPEAEHEEQVDYGTDEITAPDESVEEGGPSPPTEVGLGEDEGGQPQAGKSLNEQQHEHPPQLLHQRPGSGQTDTDAIMTDAAVGGAGKEAESVTDEKADKQGAAADAGGPAEGEAAVPATAAAAMSMGTPAAADKEDVKEPGATAGTARQEAGEQHPNATEATKAAAARPDPTRPPVAGSGRKRQPIEFKMNEVEQRVAAKRAAREVVAGEGVGAAAPAQDKATPAARPAVTAAPAGKAQSAAAAEAASKEPAEAVTEKGAVAAAPPVLPEAPMAPEGPAATATGRAAKIQKLDLAGRKAGLVAAAGVVAAARSPGVTPPAAKGAGAAAAGAATAKKPSAPPPPLEGPATKALRIDGFVRPFTENQVRQFMLQHGTVEDLWMPTIKNYCYVVFAEVAHGEAAAAATNGVVWPSGNPTSILKPCYVSPEDAATAIANGRAGLTDPPKGGAVGPLKSPGTALVAGGGGGGSTLTSPKGGPTTAPLAPVGAGVRRDTLTAAVAAAAADAAAAKQKTPAGGGPGSGGNATAGRKRPEPEAESPAAADANTGGPGDGAAVAQPAPVAEAVAAPEPTALSLDDLFKKTNAKPVIYWLPLSEEAAATAGKKRREEEAAARKAEDEEAAEQERERARRQQPDRERERDRDRAGDRGGWGALPPPPPLPGPPPARDGRGGYDRDRQGYGRDRR